MVDGQFSSEKFFEEKYRESNVAEFFRKNLQMLGYSGSLRNLTTIVHEFVTNGLDACEEAGILPEITVKITEVSTGIKDMYDRAKVTENKKLRFFLEQTFSGINAARIEKLKSKLPDIDFNSEPKDLTLDQARKLVQTAEELGFALAVEQRYVVSVEDNGIGIPESFIPKILGRMLAGTKFHRYIQSRGQQGIGAVGAIMFSQMTTGKPVTIITSTGKGTIIEAQMSIDVKKNEPRIHSTEKKKGDWRGTKIVAEYGDVVYNRSEQSAYEYVRRSAVANPHAKFVLIEPDGTKTTFSRTLKDLPTRPKEMQPHPLGLNADDLLGFATTTDARKVSSFLQSNLSRMSAAKVEELAKVVKQVDFDKDPKKLTHDDAQAIVMSFKKIQFHAPPTDGMVPIEEAALEKSIKEIFEPEFYAVVTRKPAVYKGGIPFQVEVAIGYGGKSGRFVGGQASLELMRFANRVPLLFDAGGCAITSSVKDVDWKRYQISDIETAPITVAVNLISPHIPYTSAGKQAVADDEEILKELSLALQDAGRKLKSHLVGLHHKEMHARRRAIFEKYVPEVVTALAGLTEEKESVIKKDFEKIIKTKLDDIETEEAVENGGEARQGTEETGFGDSGSSEEG